MNENLKHSTATRILLFLVIVFISGLIGSGISALFMFAGDVGMKIAQGLSSIMMFVVPPIVYYYITRKENQLQELGFRSVNQPWPFYILIGVALMFVSLPVTNQLSIWNEGFHLGGVFEKLGELMTTLEEQAAAITEKMLTWRPAVQLVHYRLDSRSGRGADFPWRVATIIDAWTEKPSCGHSPFGSHFLIYPLPVFRLFAAHVLGHPAGLYVLRERIAVDEHLDALRQQRHGSGVVLP